MGLRGSTLGGNKNNHKKNKFPERKQKNTPSQQVNDEDQELEAMRRTIAEDPESFILNNLMMSVQFFENFEEDMNHIKETLASSYEEKLNKVLPPSKHVLLPDVLQKHIARNIDFTSKRQTGNLIIEPLQPIRMYIVHDNIEITEQHYLSEYSSLNNGITYNMMIQPSEKPGYVRLRCLDEIPYMRNLGKKENIDPSSTTDYIYYGDGELYGQNTRTKLPKQTKENDRPVSSNYNIKSSSSSILQDDEITYGDQAYISRRNIYGSQTIHDIQHRSSSATEESGHGAIKKTSTVHGVAGSLGSSGYHSDISNYLYNKTTPNTSRKICSNAEIPSDCFKEVRINSEGKIYSTQEERYSKPQNSQQFRLMMADRQYDSNVLYISSKMFMNYFVNLFVNQLAEPLGFKQEDLNFVEDSVIHCCKILESHSPRRRRIDSYEITPTIWLQWPEYAQEWLDRPRSTWPDYNDINKVKDLGCHVIPIPRNMLIPENSLPNQNLPSSRRSRYKTTKTNIYQEIEWQLTFPAAERYLETCMTRSQVQVYLIALMLHKTFLRPVQEKMNGLTINHIRNKLFWLIEEFDRPFLWPDNRMGDRLIKLLKSLYYCISQTDPILRDYFVRDKNMFQKVPKEYLMHSQKQLKRIIENPVMYVFNAFENIKHSDQFFPKLDLPYLLKILTVKPWLAVVNPALDVQVHRKLTEREEYYNKTGGFWAQTKNQKIYSHVVANRTMITTRKAMDNIVEISERCADDLEGPRLAAVLNFFVRHFIKMADCCHRYRADPQKIVYLDQADRLSIILSEQNVRYKDDAKVYRDKIKAMRKRITTNPTTRSQKNEPPETPKRNMEPIFVGNLKDRFAQHVAEVHPSRDEQPYSTREDYTDNKVANKAVHEVRFQDDEKHAKVKFATAASYNEDTYTKNPVDQSKEDLYKRHPDHFQVSMGKSDEDLYSRNPISMDRSDEELYSKNPTSIGKSDEDLYSRNPTSMGKSDEDLYSKNPTSMDKSDENSRTGNPTSTDQSNELASVVSTTKQVISLTDNLLETTYI